MGYSDGMLPVHIFILALVLSALISIVWTTLRLGMSPMPSSGKAVQAMLAATDGAGEGTIVDLGSGWGTLAIAFARQYPDRQIIGYEVSFFPWLISVLFRHLLALENLVFLRQNFLDADLGGASVLLCYLYPGGMTAIQEKLNSSPPKGDTLIVSNTFALPGFKPVQIVHLKDPYLTPIYVYHHKPVNSHV